MLEIFVYIALIIAIALAFFLVKVLIDSKASFPSQHIHDSEPMRRRGIHCVLEQDREMRIRSRLAVSERSEK